MFGSERLYTCLYTKVTVSIKQMRKSLRWIFLVILFLYGRFDVRAAQNIEELLLELDKAIENREMYAQERAREISAMTERARRLPVGEELYLLNEKIIDQYNTFRCDSATW